MKGIIASVFITLSGLSAIALATRPSDPYPDRLRLSRTTDPHPNRAAEAAGFAEKNPGLWLYIDNSSNNLEKIIVQSSSGVGPDMFDTYGGSQLQTYVESGIAYDISQPAKELGFSIDKDSWPAARGELSYEGKQYSYPANVNANILIYNKNIFDRFGVPYPKENITWDEFFELAKKLTRGTGANRVYGVAPLPWSTFLETQHAELFSKDGARLLVTGKEMQTTFQMYHDMLFKYRVAPTSLDLKAMSGQGGFGSGSINQFADGRFAMINVGKWALTNFRSAHTDQSEKLKKWQANPQRDPKNRPAVLRLGSVLLPRFAGKTPSYGVSARSVSINALGPNKEKALKFLTFLASKEYAQIVNSAVDALPGNPKYADAGLEEGNLDLSEMEMHRNTIKTMKYGYQRKPSPFLLSSDAERVLGAQISRLESDPNLPIMTVLKDAEEELARLMQRNLDRDPKLRAEYKALTGSETVVTSESAPMGDAQ